MKPWVFNWIAFCKTHFTLMNRQKKILLNSLQLIADEHSHENIPTLCPISTRQLKKKKDPSFLSCCLCIFLTSQLWAFTQYSILYMCLCAQVHLGWLGVVNQPSSSLLPCRCCLRWITPTPQSISLLPHLLSWGCVYVLTNVRSFLEFCGLTKKYTLPNWCPLSVAAESSPPLWRTP